MMADEVLESLPNGKPVKPRLRRNKPTCISQLFNPAAYGSGLGGLGIRGSGLGVWGLESTW